MKVRISPDIQRRERRWTRRDLGKIGAAAGAVLVGWYFNSRGSTDTASNEQTRLFGDLSATATAGANHYVAGNAYNILTPEQMRTVQLATGMIVFQYTDGDGTGSVGTGWIAKNDASGLIIVTADHVADDKGQHASRQIYAVYFGRPRDPHNFAHFMSGQLQVETASGQRDGEPRNDMALIHIQATAVPDWLRAAPALSIAQSPQLDAGSMLVAAGVPYEFGPGIVTDDSLSTTQLYVNGAPVKRPPDRGVFYVALEGDEGMSGAPMLDAKTLAVVGMLDATVTLDRHTSAATTIDTLPQLLAAS